jgi:serine/threonine protein phosphatase PrpC
MRSDLVGRLQDLFEAGPAARAIQSIPGIAIGSLKGPREDNQDRACIAYIQYPDTNQAALVGVVCDGMGGMSEGGRAAALALSTFLAEMTESLPLPQMLRNGIEAANDAVFMAFRGRGGTTLTAVAVSQRGDTWSVHAGDSRLYGFGRERILEMLSLDDTLSAVIHRSDPNADEDNLDNRLLQFVGIGNDFTPHLLRLESRQEQTWMLTSDGIHGLGKQILHNVTQHARSGIDVARKLLFVVDASPVGDNGTVVCLTPKEFVPPKRYHAGLSMTVWSPEGHVELWLGRTQNTPNALREPEPAAITAEVALPSPKKVQKPKTSRQRTARKAPEKKEKLPKKSPESGAPLLNIVLKSDGVADD